MGKQAKKRLTYSLPKDLQRVLRKLYVCPYFRGKTAGQNFRQSYDTTSPYLIETIVYRINEKLYNKWKKGVNKTPKKVRKYSLEYSKFDKSVSKVRRNPVSVFGSPLWKKAFPFNRLMKAIKLAGL